MMRLSLRGAEGWNDGTLEKSYKEFQHTPLFIWNPRSGCKGERRNSLVQTVDLPATLLEFFGVSIPPDMQGVPLRDTIAADRPVREAGLFGVHGGHVNVTDGRYVYMRAPASESNRPLFNYTHMPTHMKHTFSLEEMRTATMHPPFSFTKGCPVMRIEAGKGAWNRDARGGTVLFDMAHDPSQQHPVDDPAIEAMMTRHLVRLMKENDAPAEQYARLGLDPRP